MVYHNLPKFGDYRYGSSGDIFLVCHVIKQDHVLKVSSDLIGRSP